MVIRRANLRGAAFDPRERHQPTQRYAKHGAALDGREAVIRIVEKCVYSALQPNRAIEVAGERRRPGRLESDRSSGCRCRWRTDGSSRSRLKARSAKQAAAANRRPLPGRRPAMGAQDAAISRSARPSSP